MTTKAKKKKYYFLSEGKLYLRHEEELYSSSEEIDVPVEPALTCWNKSKLPLELYRQIVSFFQEGYKKVSSENLVYLYYSPEKDQWLTWAPPQKCVGMRVGAIPDDPEYDKQRAEIPHDFLQMGTVHHHCTGKAFASNTDENDECDRDGLHITLGGIGLATKDKTLNYHARATFQGNTVDVPLPEWVEPPEWLENVPPDLRLKLFIDMLKHPAAEYEVPETWMSNLKKTTYTNRSSKTGTGAGFGRHHTISKDEQDEIDKSVLLRKFYLKAGALSQPGTVYYEKQDLGVIVDIFNDLGIQSFEVDTIIDLDSIKRQAKPAKAESLEKTYGSLYRKLLVELSDERITITRARYLLNRWDINLELDDIVINQMNEENNDVGLTDEELQAQIVKEIEDENQRREKKAEK